MTPLCQITFVVLLISVVNVDLFLNSRHYDGMGTLYHFQIYFAKVKINFALMKINFTIMKIDFALMKINFAIMKINFAKIKTNFALIEIFQLYTNENLLIIQKRARHYIK